MVALDGFEIQPLQVDEVFVHPGETIDIVIVANQSPARYWVRAHTPRAGKGPTVTPDGKLEEVNDMFI